MKKVNQQGRSMIEMLGVLGIIGILTVGGFGLVNKTRTSHEISKAVDELTLLAQKSRLYVRDEETVVDNTDITDKIQKMASDLDYNTTGKYFEGPDDIQYKITALKQDASANPKYALFVIDISNVPEEMCMEFATNNLGSATSSGFLGRKIGATNTDWLKDKDTLSSEPIGIGTAASSCSGRIKVSFAFR